MNQLTTKKKDAELDIPFTTTRACTLAEKSRKKESRELGKPNPILQHKEVNLLVLDILTHGAMTNNLTHVLTRSNITRNSDLYDCKY